MPAYIITYELPDNPNVGPLEDELERYPKWARVTSSTWVVVTDKSAKEIRDSLVPLLEDEDRLFVVRSGTEAAWRNVRCSNDWLKKNL